MSSQRNSAIELDNVGQSFESHQQQINLFKDVQFLIEQGQSYAITGPSGSGKSSLLMLASGLEQPSTGQVRHVKQGKYQAIGSLRAEIGFIFQQFHLLPELSALNNVALPLKLRGDKHALATAKQWLEHVGLAHRLDHKPSQLSGGEQQRIAIARALVFKPKFIFADEPTGNLDAKSATGIVELLFKCCSDNGAALVLVTHSQKLAARAQHQLNFEHGNCVWLTHEKRGEVHESA